MLGKELVFVNGFLDVSKSTKAGVHHLKFIQKKRDRAGEPVINLLHISEILIELFANGALWPTRPQYMLTAFKSLIHHIQAHAVVAFKRWLTKRIPLRHLPELMCALKRKRMPVENKVDLEARRKCTLGMVSIGYALGGGAVGGFVPLGWFDR
jgi:hypothetical protein